MRPNCAHQERESVRLGSILPTYASAQNVPDREGIMIEGIPSSYKLQTANFSVSIGGQSATQ